MAKKRSAVDVPQLRGNTVVGLNIRRIRKDRQLTLEEVAHSVGTDTGNLSRLERGLQGYTDDGLRKLAKVLRSDVREFFAEEPLAGYEAAHANTVPCLTIPVFDAEASMGMGIVAYPERETVVGGLQLSETWVRNKCRLLLGRQPRRDQRRPDKTIVMKSDNPLYDPYAVPAADMDTFRVIGKVVFAWNGKKM